MIHAFKSHKISGKIRNDLCNLEDAKTSSIIGTLSYLPGEMFWQILYNSIKRANNGIEKSGEIKEILYWPSWKFGSKRVEPDVFIRFEKFDVIVELKRNNYNQQYSVQWKNEIGAYHQEYGNSTPVYLIAISGRTNESLPNVYQCSWTALLDEVNILYDDLKIKTPYSSEVRILQDVLIAFNIHKEFKFYYFKDVTYDVNINRIREYSSLFSSQL